MALWRVFILTNAEVVCFCFMKIKLWSLSEENENRFMILHISGSKKEGVLQLGGIRFVVIERTIYMVESNIKLKV